MIRMYDPNHVQPEDPRKVDGCWAIKDVMAAVLDRYQLGPVAAQKVSTPLPVDTHEYQPDLSMVLASS